MEATKQYEGTCYIGYVGPESDIGECRDSIESIQRRPGDGRPVPIRATKGYEARNLHFDKWLNHSSHDWMLLLDHDMIFPPDTLERLRSHRLPYVSGYYLRRRYRPIAPVWFEPMKGTEWPMKPFTADPELGRLHELGGSGWGCILIHREAAEATNKVMRDELPVLEDDMDIWPYDLNAVSGALKALRTLTTEQTEPDKVIPALTAQLDILEREIRVLRGVKDPVGSDIRYPFFAKQAGFTLYGDPDVRCAHVLNYPLSPDDYSNLGEGNLANEATTILRGFWHERRRMKETRDISEGAVRRCDGCDSLNPVEARECATCGKPLT